MRVAFDVGPLRPDPAGVGVYVRSLLTALLRDAPEITVVPIGMRGDVSIPGAEDAPRRGLTPYPYWLQFQAPLAIRKARVDVLHCTDGLVPLAHRGKTVLTVHDLSIMTHWRSHLSRRLARVPLAYLSPHLANRLIVDSSAGADEIMSFLDIPASRIDIVPLAPREGTQPSPVELAETLSRLHLEPGAFILAPGTLEPRKNHRAVIAAFEILAAKDNLDPDVQLVLAGRRGWQADTILDAIRDSRYVNRVKWLGYVSDADLTALMSSAAIVVYASQSEGFGLPVLEAMAVGAAVVTSGVSSMPEIAADAGILVDPTDARDIARGMAEAFAGRTDLGRSAFARAQLFTWSQTAAATVEVYGRVHAG
jgi:glycosyltransferase involved in cell wall biosynthesis